MRRRRRRRSTAATPRRDRPAPLDAARGAAHAHSRPAADAARRAGRRRARERSSAAWDRVARTLGHALQQALPAHDGANHELARRARAARSRASTAKARRRALADDARGARARRVERVLQHRHHLFDQLGKLCHELTSSLTDLAENDSWVKGQCEAMQLKIEEGLSARGVRAVSDMLHHARKRQGEVRGEREKARDALKALIDADARRARRARLQDRQLPRERRPLRRR